MTQATSSLDAKKRTKRPHEKVRTGCITCRIRRIKCDEAKPACQRCTRTGRKCDGYDFILGHEKTALEKSSLRNLKKKAPKTADFEVFRSVDLSGVQPHSSSATAEEWNTFQYFTERTKMVISCLLEDDRVFDYALRLYHVDDTIKSILLCMASVHQMLFRPSQDSSSQRVFLWTQYNRALRGLIKANKVGPDSGIFVMACLLLAAADGMIGKNDLAQQHFVGGYQMLLAYQASDARSRTKEADEIIESFSYPLMSAYSSQAALFREPDVVAGAYPDTVTDDAASPAGRNFMNKILLSLPQQIESPHHGRILLDNMIQNHILRLPPINHSQERGHWNWQQQSSVQIVETGEDRDVEIASIKSAMLFLTDRIELYVSQNIDSVSPPSSRLGINMLRNHEFAATIMARTLLSNHADASADDEMVHDRYTRWYNSLTHRLQTVIQGYRDIAHPLDEWNRGREETIAPNDDPSTATYPPSCSLDTDADLGLIPILFLVATRCRESTIRRHAISLLRSLHRSEGSWNSYIAANIAETIMDIEERPQNQPVLQQSAGYPRRAATGADIAISIRPPEKEDRIRAIDVEILPTSGKLVLSYLKYPYTYPSPTPTPSPSTTASPPMSTTISTASSPEQNSALTPPTPISIPTPTSTPATTPASNLISPPTAPRIYKEAVKELDPERCQIDFHSDNDIIHVAVGQNEVDAQDRPNLSKPNQAQAPKQIQMNAEDLGKIIRMSGYQGLVKGGPCRFPYRPKKR